MVAKIHHATKARADKLGLDIRVNEKTAKVEVGLFEFNPKPFGSDIHAPTALKQAEQAILDEFDEDGGDEDGGRSFDERWEDAVAAATDAGGDPGDKDAEDGEDGEAGKSVVKHKYKAKYRPFKQTCGDDLALAIKAHVSVSVIVDGKSVKRVDGDKLRRFAKVNDCWQDSYAHLNVGMQRMSIGNRLRNKVVKHGYEVKWV